MFSLHVYEERRSRLKALMPEKSLAIISAAHEVIRNRDAEYPFRQSSDFWYLTGFTEPDAVLVIGPGQPDRLFVRPKNPDQEVWTGRRLGPEHVKTHLGVDEGFPIEALDTELGRLLADVAWVEYPFYCQRSSEIVDRALKAKGIKPRRHDLLSHRVDLSRHLHQARLIKSPEEVDAMRKAGRISALGHVAAMQACEPGMTEDQLASVVEHCFRMEGSPAVAYQTIVGGGDNACILHYIDRSGRLHSGDLVLIDAGCEYKGYASDITRSWPVSGKFSEAQAEIYQIVLDSQLAAIDKCRVGNPYDAPHKEARRVLAEGLIKIGVIKQSLDEAIGPDGELNNWYMHGTGHWLGLDVHDVGIYRPNDEPRLFEEGMVITVEPGLYFGAWRPDVDCPERYANIGIRIEDDVLITNDGPDVLSKDCPKTITDIEALVGTA